MSKSSYLNAFVNQWIISGLAILGGICGHVAHRYFGVSVADMVPILMGVMIGSMLSMGLLCAALLWGFFGRGLVRWLKGGK